MAKKKLFTGSIGEKTMREIWDLYTLSQTAKGITDITLRNYAQHLHSISKHLDIDVPMSKISKQDLDMMVVSMMECLFALTDFFILSLGVVIAHQEKRKKGR